MNERRITTDLLFTDETVAASGSTTSVAIDLRELTGNGIFSLHAVLSGSGTAKIEYLSCSTEGGTFLTPSSAADIDTSMGAGSDIIPFAPELTPFMKIKVTETGGANSITIDNMWLNKQ